MQCKAEEKARDAERPTSHRALQSKLHANRIRTTMNENREQQSSRADILGLHGTRPVYFVTTSARSKLVFALLSNHKLFLPQGKRTYSKMSCYGRARRDNFDWGFSKWKLSIGVVVGLMYTKRS